MSYWGHAARVRRDQSQIKIVLAIRGPQWALGHRDDIRCLQAVCRVIGQIIPGCCNCSGMTIGKVAMPCSGWTKPRTGRLGDARLQNLHETDVDVKKVSRQLQ